MRSREDIRVRIVEEITAAFAPVTLGQGVSLRQAGVLAEFGSEEEASLARCFDADVPWQDVSDEDIERSHGALGSLDPAGLRYYLPAYLVWSLKHSETSVSSAVDAPIYRLTPSDSPQWRKADLARFQVFNTAQSRVICRYLRFMAEGDEDRVDVSAARRALDKYWHQFCG